MGVGTGYTIAAESTPVLDGWGWADHWGPEHWIDWHKKMKAKWGADKANEIFISNYHQAGFGAESYNWRTFNSDFKDYAKANGFYDALYQGLAGLVGKLASAGATVVGVVADTTDKVVTEAGDIVDNAGKTLSNVSKLLKWLIPVVIIVVVVLGIMYLKKNKLKV